MFEDFEMHCAIFLGSEKDMEFAKRIPAFWKKMGIEIPYSFRVLSAHKLATAVLGEMKMLEGKHDSLVYIAVAGRSNALGPLISGHTSFPVINCPPSEKPEDWFSSLRMPSLVPCSTILEPENAALHVAEIIGIHSSSERGKIESFVAKEKKKLLEGKNAKADL